MVQCSRVAVFLQRSGRESQYLCLVAPGDPNPLPALSDTTLMQIYTVTTLHKIKSKRGGKVALWLEHSLLLARTQVQLPAPTW